MDFLKWIRNFSNKYKNREFQSEIKKEKQQKYLFRDSWSQLEIKRWGLFREKKKILKPFTSFFQWSIFHTASRFFEDTKILGYIGILLIILSGYIVIFSSYFQISPSKVLIESIDEGIDINIAYRSIEDVYEENIFLFDESVVAANLKKYQNNIKKIQIDSLYPNGLKILIESYPVKYRTTISSRKNGLWWLSENGVLIPYNREKLQELPAFEIITDIGEDELLDYKSIISETKLLAINKVIDLFRAEWSDIAIGKIRYLSRENELHISLENGGRILFALQDFSIQNTQTDIYKNLKDEIITLRSYISSYRNVLTDEWLIYLDVRIPGKIFVCREKESCNVNLKNIYWENYQ